MTDVTGRYTRHYVMTARSAEVRSVSQQNGPDLVGYELEGVIQGTNEQVKVTFLLPPRRSSQFGWKIRQHLRETYGKLYDFDGSIRQPGPIA